MPPRTDLRWGQIYGIDVIDHDSWMAGAPVIVDGDYVGQSRQKRRARENQHRDSQAFADLIVGSPRVLWEGWCTDTELDEMERRFIQDVPLEQRPRLNYLLNEDNPHRIPKYTLKEQRHARDDRRGEPHWEPTEYQPQAYGYRSQPAVRVRQAWKPWQKHLLGWPVGWLLSTIAGWVGLVVKFDFTTWWHPLATAAAGLPSLIVVVLLGWLLVRSLTSKPKRRRSKRKRR